MMLPLLNILVNAAQPGFTHMTVLLRIRLPRPRGLAVSTLTLQPKQKLLYTLKIRSHWAQQSMFKGPLSMKSLGKRASTLKTPTFL